MLYDYSFEIAGSVVSMFRKHVMPDGAEKIAQGMLEKSDTYLKFQLMSSTDVPEAMGHLEEIAADCGAPGVADYGDNKTLYIYRIEDRGNGEWVYEERRIYDEELEETDYGWYSKSKEVGYDRYTEYDTPYKAIVVINTDPIENAEIKLRERMWPIEV